LCRDAAAAAEERGERDIDLFVRQLTALSLREHDNPGQVAVMTIHKAKGLDWDLVIVTDLEGTTLMERRGGLEVHRRGDGEIAWVLDMPPSELAQFDPALAQRIRLSKESAAFERLCVLYVGLTRAKTALYVVTHPAKGESKNFPRLLAETLEGTPQPTKIGASEFVCAWESGDRDWINRTKPTRHGTPPAQTLPLLPETERKVAAQTASLQPSAEKGREIQGDALLAQDRRQRDLGTELHAALSQIEWWDENTPPAADGEAAALSEEAQRAVKAIFADAASRKLFSAPPVATKLWREMPFEILIDHHWISGRFDRVAVTLDPNGKAVAARIIDFKVIGLLRDASAFREQHKPQMKTYRQVAARLWKLPTNTVTTTLVAISTQSAASVHVLDVE
ncbi:MAG TPA: 3'-5' exonuclease, partial [Opitutaceae bacterium]